MRRDREGPGGWNNGFLSVLLEKLLERDTGLRRRISVHKLYGAFPGVAFANCVTVGWNKSRSSTNHSFLGGRLPL